MHTSYGDMEIDIPKDRKGEFEPQIVKKYQNTITQDMEEKIISMYAKGMTTSDIESHMRELYDIDISDSTISRITDKILPIVKEWQERPLEEIYAVVFMDAIHYHVRNEGRIVKRAVYIARSITLCVTDLSSFLTLHQFQRLSGISFFGFLMASDHQTLAAIRRI